VKLHYGTQSLQQYEDRYQHLSLFYRDEENLYCIPTLRNSPKVDVLNADITTDATLNSRVNSPHVVASPARTIGVKFGD
jgi:hypothetical protein